MSEEKKPTQKEMITSCVEEALYRLSSGQNGNKPSKQRAPAERAVWRHAFAKGVCEDIKAWGLLQRDLPEELKREYGLPSYEEKAVYMAIAAYAACGSHTENVTLGAAAAEIDARDRFTRLENSDDIDEFWRNIKDLLRLISSKKGPGVDYKLLAVSIYYWQFDHIKGAIRLERDYYKKGEKNE
jgi:CRISPR type I-E-associated protein CasB/Cse2